MSTSVAPKMKAAVKHPVDQRLPIAKLLAFGFQHVLIMYAGAIAVPLVFGAATGLNTREIGILISADLLISGLITIIQSLGFAKAFGVRLPIICGGAFATLAPMIMIAEQHGMAAVYGSMLVGGLIGIPLAFAFARVIRYFPPLVLGSILTVVGLSLIGTTGGLIVGDDPTAPDYASPKYIILALTIVLLGTALLCLGRGLIRQLAILIALAVGTVTSIAMGLYDFKEVSSSSWLGIPPPFHFGTPEFPLTGVIAMTIVMLVVYAESTANMLAVSEITGRQLKHSDLGRGLAGDGLSSILGAVFNAFIDTVYSGNVGAVATTRVYSRYVTALSGLILILLGLIPKLGALIAGVPSPVIGAVSLMMFGTVAVVGIKTLGSLNFNDPINLTIVAVTLALGLLPSYAPDLLSNFNETTQMIFGSGITIATICSFSLNLLFNHTPLGKKARSHMNEH